MSTEDGTEGSSYKIELGTRISAVADEIGTRTSAAKIAGISDDMLYRYIAGRSKVSFEPVARMCESLDVSLDWLHSGKGPMHKESESRGYNQKDLDRKHVLDSHGVSEPADQHISDRAANFKEATELMISMADDSEACPPGVWSALIIELMLSHGLTASGSKRIMETVEAIKKRNGME
ncbi:MAG: helix-turn-helix transcriptional regulator [Gammaproteobacteria bacterium]|nr:helix-turn-helix transcriptional regulator [Gammaproteobacteria bacterium]